MSRVAAQVLQHPEGPAKMHRLGAGAGVTLRPVWAFLARLTAGMIVLWLAWILVGPAYRKYVAALGNLAFAAAAPGYRVEFREFTQWQAFGLDSRADLAVLVHRPQWVDGEGRAQHLLAKRIVAFSQPYAATTFLIALFAATRLRWRARLGRLAVALLALHALMLACVAIDVVHTFVGGGSWPHLPRGFVEVLSVLKVTITDWPAGVYLVPLVLWMLTCWPGQSKRRARTSGSGQARE